MTGKKRHTAEKKKREKFRKSGKGTRKEWSKYKKENNLPKYQPI